MKEKCRKVPDNCILSSLVNGSLQIIFGRLALERRWTRREFRRVVETDDRRNRNVGMEDEKANRNLGVTFGV